MCLLLIEDYLQIIVYFLENGELPAYDDEKRTLHLGQISSVIFPTLDQRLLFVCLNLSKYLQKNAVQM